MRVIRRACELDPEGRRICVAIGVFDGVHLGHQQVIHQTLAEARQHQGLAVVVTFDRHPHAVVCPEQAPAMIYPLSKKLQVLESFGLDATLLLRFDQALSHVPAESFIRELAQAWGMLFSISVGTHFNFGYRRAGNLALLRQLGQAFHFSVHGLTAVSLGGRAISSTRIRETIGHGRLELVNQMLGRSYTLAGRVVAGDRLGRTLGFPTANLDATGLILPPSGVYAVQAVIREQRHPAVLNIGYRPTLQRSEPQLRVEAHLLDFDGDLYDQPMEILFLSKIRSESRFPSREALSAQIARDIAAARAVF
jgi:riboflavin kinase/FMN adenylyltransferase